MIAVKLMIAVKVFKIWMKLHFYFMTIEKVVFVFLGIIWKRKKKETKYLVNILYAVLQFTNCLWKPKCIGYYTMLSQAHTVISGAVLSPVPHRWKHMKKSISNLQKSNLIE